MADTVETAVYRLRVEGQAEIDRLTTSVDGLSVAEEKAASSTRTFSQALQNNVARIDPLVRAQEQYKKALETNLRYRETGVGTEAQLNAQLEASTRRYQQQVSVINQVEKATASQTGATKLQRYELINLSRQMQDVGVSLIGGQSPFTVLVQQGSQIADIFASSGVSVKDAFKGMAASAAAFLGTGGMIATGVAAAGAGLAYLAVKASDARKQTELALSGPGAASGMQPADITRFTQQNASLLGASRAQLKEVAEDWAHTGKIAVNELTGVGEAVLGLSVKTKTGFAEAGTSLGKLFAADDLTKAVDALSGEYPELNANIRDSVDALQQQGERAKATQLIMDTMAESNRKAAASQSALTLTSNALSNALQFRPLEGPAKSLQDRLGAAQEHLTMTQRPELGFSAAEIETARQDVARLNEELTKLKKTAEQTKLDMIGNEATKMARDLDPTIQKLTEVRLAIQRVKEAQASGAPGANTPAVGDLLTKLQNQEQVLVESQGQASRLNERVKEIGKSWGDVGQSTALALQAAQNNLPVLEAVGGAAKMAAQAAADYANAIDQGKTATEAAALAASNHAAAQAQVNASAKETLFNLQNQAAAAGAVTGAQQMAAQAAATYNQMVHEGVDATIAAAVAAQQLANAHAAATANVMRQVSALNDSTTLIQAQTADIGTGAHNAEMMAAAGIAYKNAIESGASAASAAALSSATIANYMAKAALEAARMDQALVDAYNKANQAAVDAVRIGGKSLFAPTGQFDVKAGTRYESTTEEGLAMMREQQGLEQQARDAKSFADQVAAVGSGGIGAALSFAMAQQARPAVMGGVVGSPSGIQSGSNNLVLQQAINESDIISQVSSLTDALNRQTSDKATQAANLRAEMQWLQSRPTSIEQQDQMAQLRQSIEELTQSTDSLNATNQELLSPYYTQDPRTSHIGFRSQGMATGGWVDVPGGYSANDNMVATIPVASGERIFVDPMGARRTATGPGHTTINISQPIMIQGNANKDELGRTLFQSNQSLAKQIGAATAR